MYKLAATSTFTNRHFRRTETMQFREQFSKFTAVHRQIRKESEQWVKLLWNHVKSEGEKEKKISPDFQWQGNLELLQPLTVWLIVRWNLLPSFKCLEGSCVVFMQINQITIHKQFTEEKEGLVRQRMPQRCRQRKWTWTRQKDSSENDLEGNWSLLCCPL